MASFNHLLQTVPCLRNNISYSLLKPPKTHALYGGYNARPRAFMNTISEHKFWLIAASSDRITITTHVKCVYRRLHCCWKWMIYYLQLTFGRSDDLMKLLVITYNAPKTCKFMDYVSIFKSFNNAISHASFLQELRHVELDFHIQLSISPIMRFLTEGFQNSLSCCSTLPKE